tara:strand:- start:159 stop:797 length:639 start_codon:yes stop_codon:yes gene_type:complete
MPSIKHSEVKLNYDINIVFAFLAVGVLLLFIGKASPIWGYSWMSLALMALLFTVLSQLLLYTNDKKQEQQSGILSLLRSLWKYGLVTAPITLLFGLISWYVGQYTKYKKKIENGNLPREYYNFYNASTTLLVFEVVSLYNMITELLHISRMESMQKKVGQQKQTNNVKKSKYMNLLEMMQARDDTIFYGFILLSYIMAGFMHVILANFITDG